MSNVAQLYDLQLLDSELDQARARLNEIEAALNDNEVLQKAQKTADLAEANMSEAQKRLNSAESEVQAQQSKFENNQKTLYSGSVTNPKELEDLQNEAEALKRHLSTLEERQLEHMLVFDESQNASEMAQRALNEVKTQVANENSSLTDEQKDLLARVHTLEAQREQASEALESESRQLYQDLRSENSGIAVTLMIDDSCQACGVNLITSQVQVVRSPSQLARCNNCGRILFAG